MNRILWQFALTAALAAGAAGCSHHAHLRHAAAAPPGQAIGNPLFIPIADHEIVWDQVVDEVDDYFKISREERVRVVGNVLTEGRVETYPIAGATFLEPWRKDSAAPYERMFSTLQSVRRHAVVRVAPAEGGYSVEVAVFKELEDVSRPEHSTVGETVLRHDGSLVRVELDAETTPVTLGWIPQGRDAAMEQRIISGLSARFAGLQPPAAVPNFRVPHP